MGGIIRRVGNTDSLCFSIESNMMDKEIEFVKRKPTRLKDFDYSSSGAYFITICTQNRRNILSKIVGEGSLSRETWFTNCEETWFAT